MARKKNAVKAVAMERAVQTREEAEVELREIGRLQRAVTVLEGKLNEDLTELKVHYEGRAKPLNDELTQRFHALQVWAEANRDELLVDGGKTATLATGELTWRFPPPSVRLTGADKVLETLKRLGLARFIRTKEEVSKEAILADPAAVAKVAGITVTQKEEFVAKPFETEIERAQPVKRTTS